METIPIAEGHGLMQAAEVYTVHSTLEISGSAIECESLALRFDEEGQDFITATATVAGKVTGFDARTAPRATLTAWLEFTDRDVQTAPMVLDLVVRAKTRTVKAGEDTTTILMQSLESLIRDDAARTTRTFTAASKLTEAFTAIIGSVLPAAPVLTSIPPSTTFLTGDTTLEWAATRQSWATITEMCDGASTGQVEAFHDGTAFVLRPRPQLGDPVYTFTDQANLVSFIESESREEFYNAAMVTRSGGAVALVEDASPVFGVGAVGRKLKIVDTKIQGVPALAFAQAVIDRAIRSGQSFTITTPDTPLGLRPGATIATYVEEFYQAWQISSIDLDLKHGGATLTTRKDN